VIARAFGQGIHQKTCDAIREQRASAHTREEEREIRKAALDQTIKAALDQTIAESFPASDSIFGSEFAYS
jgi:hypothetical protein